MLITKPNALGVVEATLGKIKKVKRPVSKFIIHIVELWLGMNCRYVFSNMERWGNMTEKSYRLGFSKFFDWFKFNYALVQQHCTTEIIAVFDPSYIKKNGKQTYGMGMFWSGVRQRALRGLEIGCLAFVDVANGTALHGIAAQTPSPKTLKEWGKTLIHHYVGIIEAHIEDIKSMTGYLAVDGYFMKKDFIKPLLKQGLHIITKGRQDANLKYLYKGRQKGGKGRPKLYDGKVNIGAIDKRKIKCCYQDEDKEVYAAIVYCVQLKQQVLAAFIYYGEKKQSEIIIGTDIAMDAMRMCRYYGLRFQVEFLIRDAKQYAGLEDCQARDEQKLHTHFNIAMTVVSIAKATYHLSIPVEQRGSFSMADIKMLHMNQLITKRIFSNLALDLSCRKIKHIYNQCLNFGRCKRNSVSHPSFTFFVHKFTNPTYEIFLKIDWDRLRDKEMYEFDDYREYEKLKEAEIRSSFLFKNTGEVEDFYNIFSYLKKVSKNDWSYNTTLDYVIDENCSINFELGCLLLIKVIERNNEANYIPRVVFRNHLNSEEKANRIWGILQHHKFINKGLWELSFYDYIDDSLLTKEYVQALVITVSSMKQANTIHFDRLQRFLTIEPNLFQIILRTIVEKNEKEGTRLQVWMDFFSKHFEQLGDDIEFIEKAYLQQIKINKHSDIEGKAMIKILSKDSKFLLEYVKGLYQQKKFGLEGERLAFVWQISNIEIVLEEVFNFTADNDYYTGVLAHFCNSFFWELAPETKLRAKNLLLAYLKKNNDDPKKVNIVVDISRHSMKEFFEEVLLLFLSLNQNKNTFSEIWWRGNGTSGSGNVILSDVEMADWRNILSIVEKSTVGINLIPLKKYLNEQIEHCQKSGDYERQRRFLERY